MRSIAGTSVDGCRGCAHGTGEPLLWFDLRYMATRSRFKKCSPRALSGGATWLWVTWTVNRSGPSEFLPKKPAQFLAVGFGERSEGWARRPYLEATERDRLFDYHSGVARPLAAQIENGHRLALHNFRRGLQLARTQATP